MGQVRVFLSNLKNKTIFYFCFQKSFLVHFSITFVSATQVLGSHKNISYFFAETLRVNERLEVPLSRPFPQTTTRQKAKEEKCITEVEEKALLGSIPHLSPDGSNFGASFPPNL